MSTFNLSEKAVLANFTISRWGGQRLDETVTKDTNTRLANGNDVGSYRKKLLPPKATLKIDTIVYAARNYHRAKTQPWLDDGTRVLPSTLAMEYAAKIHEFQSDFGSAVDEFITHDYPAHLRSAPRRMGSMFKKEDYPTPESLRNSYSFRSLILPIPDARDFRVGGIDLNEAKKEIESAMGQIHDQMLQDIGLRIQDTVGHMAERLKKYKPAAGNKKAESSFKNSLVENVRDLVALLPHFNLDADPKLAKLIDSIGKNLCKHEAEDLRLDSRLRTKVAKSADEVLKAISDYIA
jgi:hypothetical protein